MTLHAHDDHAPHGSGFMIGLLAGAAVGTGIALLFAPRQGADLRHDIAEGAQHAGRRLNVAYDTVAESARRNARRLADQAEGLRESFRRGADSVSEQAHDRAADASRVLRDAIGDASHKASAPSTPEPFDARSPLG